MRPPRADNCAPMSRRMPAVLDATRLGRIRWRCRRGMLENDLVLTRFLDARGAALSESEVVLLDRLLDLADTELWDLIAGRADPRDAAVMPVLQQLRAA
jgi:antitoxin CptB